MWLCKMSKVITDMITSNKLSLVNYFAYVLSRSMEYALKFSIMRLKFKIPNSKTLVVSNLEWK